MLSLTTDPQPQITTRIRFNELISTYQKTSFILALMDVMQYSNLKSRIFFEKATKQLTEILYIINHFLIGNRSKPN
jgi:hypothetical protein